MKNGKKKIFSVCIATVLAFSCLTCVACGGEESSLLSDSTSQTTEFTLSHESIKVLVGAEEYLFETGGKNVAWSSSDTNVVTVDGGVLTGVAEGTATVFAVSEGKTLSCMVTVVKSFTETDYLSFESTYVNSAYVGLNFTLGAYMVMDNQPVEGASITYTTSDESVITLDGVSATALKAGECVITASCTYDGKAYSANLTFTVLSEYATILFEGMGSRTVMVLDGEKQIDYKVFVNGVEKADAVVEWTSSNENVLTVENGTCKALKKGESTVTAKYGTAEKVLFVNVYENYVLRLENENSITKVKGTRTSWNASVTPTLEIVKGAVEGRTPDKGAFLKFSFDEEAEIYSNGLTLTNLVDVEAMKMLYAYGYTQVVIPIWVSSRTEVCAFDGSTARGYQVVQSGGWTEAVYDLGQFVSWSELNGGNYNQSQDKPLMFLVTRAKSFTMYVDSIYVR